MYLPTNTYYIHHRMTCKSHKNVLKVVITPVLSIRKNNLRKKIEVKSMVFGTRHLWL